MERKSCPLVTVFSDDALENSGYPHHESRGRIAFLTRRAMEYTFGPFFFWVLFWFGTTGNPITLLCVLLFSSLALEKMLYSLEHTPAIPFEQPITRGKMETSTPHRVPFLFPFCESKKNSSSKRKNNSIASGEP